MSALRLLVIGGIGLSLLGCGSTPTKTDQADRPGKALVQSLPADITGAELVGDAVRVKDGFGWVKQPDGTVTVQQKAADGSTDVNGTFRCFCDTGPYACEAVISRDETSIKCQNVRDCLSCKMEGWKKIEQKVSLIAY